MIRIGRQIPHFEEVDLSSLTATFSDDRRFRYLLEMKFNTSLYDTNRNKKAAVVLKNPSAADTGAADSTIRKVETYIYKRLDDVEHLSILNIFALRATDAADLNREYQVLGSEAVVGPDNDTVIRDVIGEADYVVLAWGGRSGIDSGLYAERIQQVKHLIPGKRSHRVFEVKGEKETFQPLHGMMWGYGFRLQPYQKLKEE